MPQNDMEKKVMGRPSKYNEETIPKTLEYLENFESMGDQIPSIAGLAVFLKVGRDTIHEWRKEEGKEDFSDIIENILGKQEQTLTNKGLTGDFTSTISKLILGKHGYHDKVDSEHSGSIEVTKIERKIVDTPDRDSKKTEAPPSAE